MSAKYVEDKATFDDGSGRRVDLWLCVRLSGSPFHLSSGMIDFKIDGIEYDIRLDFQDWSTTKWWIECGKEFLTGKEPVWTCFAPYGKLKFHTLSEEKSLIDIAFSVPHQPNDRFIKDEKILLENVEIARSFPEQLLEIAKQVYSCRPRI